MIEFDHELKATIQSILILIIKDALDKTPTFYFILRNSWEKFTRHPHIDPRSNFDIIAMSLVLCLIAFLYPN